MNVERLEKLAESLEGDLPKNFKFDMAELKTKLGCGTVGCIAGLTLVMFNDGRGDEYDARRLLDLHPDQASDLFFPSSIYVDYINTTPKEAAEAIRKLIATDGKESWGYSSRCYD